MLTATIITIVKDLMHTGCVYIDVKDAEAVCKYLINQKVRYEVAAVGDHYRRIELV